MIKITKYGDSFNDVISRLAKLCGMGVNIWKSTVGVKWILKQCACVRSLFTSTSQEMAQTAKDMRASAGVELDEALR